MLITLGMIQGDFVDWSSLNLFKSLYKIPYSNFFSLILLLGLEHSLIKGGPVKKTTLYFKMVFHEEQEE